MPQWILELCGWLPGIIFPTASALQLHAVIKAKNTQGVSVLSWSLFCLANFCLYIYVEKYWEPQSMA
jgi:uncharacterized protein with PQ loop repeat